MRYFNVFGPRQSPFSQYAAVIPLFITAIANDRPVTVEGDGEQRRDFTYVENVVAGTLKAGDTRGRQRPDLQPRSERAGQRERACRPDRDDRRQAGRADERTAAGR